MRKRCGYVPVSYTHLDVYKRQATIGLVPKEERAEKIKVYHEMIDFCAMAEIPAMHSHFGFIPEDPSSEPVSYTHLDVYKRQEQKR